MTTTELTKRDERGILHVRDESPDARLLDTAKFEQMTRIARAIGQSSLTPRHLVGKTQEETIANCLRVVNQAMRWGYDPFAVADETYVVHGKLGYQGKLVAAVVNTRANLVGRLRPEYSGKGDALQVRIVGRFQGEDADRDVTLTVAQAKTGNEMWKKDPEQKLWYSGVIKWARRHCPEVIMGVYTDDDLERVKESACVTGKPIRSLDDLTDHLTEETGDQGPHAEDASQTEPDEPGEAQYASKAHVSPSRPKPESVKEKRERERAPDGAEIPDGALFDSQQDAVEAGQ